MISQYFKNQIFSDIYSKEPPKASVFNNVAAKPLEQPTFSFGTPMVSNDKKNESVTSLFGATSTTSLFPSFSAPKPVSFETVTAPAPTTLTPSFSLFNQNSTIPLGGGGDSAKPSTESKPLSSNFGTTSFGTFATNPPASQAGSFFQIPAAATNQPSLFGTTTTTTTATPSTDTPKVSFGNLSTGSLFGNNLQSQIQQQAALPQPPSFTGSSMFASSSQPAAPAGLNFFSTVTPTKPNVQPTSVATNTSTPPSTSLFAPQTLLTPQSSFGSAPAKPNQFQFTPLSFNTAQATPQSQDLSAQQTPVKFGATNSFMPNFNPVINFSSSTQNGLIQFS